MAKKKFLNENNEQVWPITRIDCIYTIDGSKLLPDALDEEFDNFSAEIREVKDKLDLNNKIWTGTQEEYKQIQSPEADVLYIPIFDYNTVLGFDTEEIIQNAVPSVTLNSISVSYTGGQVEVGTPISSLNIVVKAWYSNDTSEVITDYAITEGNIVEGENIIEVTYQEKIATFKVTGYTTSINTLQVVYNGGNKEYGTVTIEDLKQYLAVTAYYSDGTKEENVTDYEIIGELKKGQNSLTVSCRGKTAKFTVYLETKIYSIKIIPIPSDAKVMIDGSNIYSKNVEGGTTVTYEVSKDGYKTKTGEIVVTKNEEITVELAVTQNVSAVRANYSGPQQPYGVTLDDLRQYLQVKAEYPDGSSEIVTDYELSGELKKNNNNVITVTYEGKSATFYVWVQVMIYTINLSVTPSDAKVTINGRDSRSENVESGSTVTYEVSKSGYITQTGEFIAMKNENIEIVLEQE